jgi:hypothetical protein
MFPIQAIHNRPIIIGILILLGVDVNCRQEVNFAPTGNVEFHIQFHFKV